MTQETPTAQASKTLCVFDLDDTLILGSVKMFEGATELCVYKSRVYVKLRAGAVELVKAMAARADVAVWSAGQPNYVNSVVALFFGDIKFRFVWTFEECTKVKTFMSSLMDDSIVFKPLSRVVLHAGTPLEHIVIVDDTEETAMMNLGNLVLVPRFYHRQNGDDDDTLAKLTTFLCSLADRCADGGGQMGTIDKRNWLRVADAPATDGTGATQPVGVCVRAPELRRIGFSDLRDFCECAENELVCRRGRIFVTRRGVRTIYHHKQSPWANPFVVDESEAGSLQLALRKYETHLRALLDSDSAVRAEFLALRSKRRIGCFCAVGEDCHRDVILRLLKE